MQAQDDAASAGPSESVIQALSNIISEANRMKTALGSSLPVSWSGNEEDAITYENLYELTEAPKIEKVDPISTAGLEMVDLLILAVELQKDNLIGKCAGSQIWVELYLLVTPEISKSMLLPCLHVHYELVHCVDFKCSCLVSSVYLPV